jgi:hypothetical protein
MELIQYWRLIVQNRIVIGASTLVGLVIAAANFPSFVNYPLVKVLHERLSIPIFMERSSKL